LTIVIGLVGTPLTKRLKDVRHVGSQQDQLDLVLQAVLCNGEAEMSRVPIEEEHRADYVVVGEVLVQVRQNVQESLSGHIT
jgi:hypothetical protein